MPYTFSLYFNSHQRGASMWTRVLTVVTAMLVTSAALARTFSPEEIEQRAIERRAIEAANK